MDEICIFGSWSVKSAFFAWLKKKVHFCAEKSTLVGGTEREYPGFVGLSSCGKRSHGGWLR